MWMCSKAVRDLNVDVSGIRRLWCETQWLLCLFLLDDIAHFPDIHRGLQTSNWFTTIIVLTVLDIQWHICHSWGCDIVTG